jgi:ABC-type branched-subunit amino acid transport system ATPase component
MVARVGEVIAEINRQGTAVLLVEQNAALALGLADTAYVLEVGRVTLHGPAAELAATDQVRDRYLGVGGGAGRGPAPAAATRPAAEPSSGAGSAAGRSGRALPALVVDGLSVRFGGVAALTDVSFTVAAGSVHALIGPNGAGKSTCLNVLSGVYPATAGSVRYGDRELTRLRPHRIARLGVGRTFQNLALSATATVADNLLLGRHRLTRAGFVGPAWVRRGPGGRRPSSAAGSARWPSWWTSTTRSTGGWTSCPTVPASGWSWPGRCPRSRRCCCWTSRWPA